MLRIQGTNRSTCEGVSRRDLMQIGGLGALGLGLADSYQLSELPASESASSPTFGRAKSCILLYLYGAHPQHETFDPKPDAPVEVQGEMQAIETNVPGVFFGEGLPQTAQVMDKVTVVRSMTHQYPLHSFSYAVTGMPTYSPSIEFSPRHTGAWPFIGSVVDFVSEQRSSGAAPTVPRNIGLPWISGSKCSHGAFAGPYSGFLSREYDPFWTEYTGAGTNVVPKLNQNQTEKVLDPWGGCTSEGTFQLSSSCELPSSVSAKRFDLRRNLLNQFDAGRIAIDANQSVTTYTKHQQRAYSLLTSNKMRSALDIHQESAKTREQYGMTLFGQSSLAARRLVEAGGKFVSVIWDAFGPFAGCVWDTHTNHFPRLKNYLLPTLDHTLPALLTDLDERGLLDETLVLCISEHGRTPKIKTNIPGGGRDHWSRVYSILAAGGGIARGKVVGASDSSAGDVKNTPISAKDLLATAYHALGIDPESSIPNRLNQPMPIAGTGVVRHELFG